MNTRSKGILAVLKVEQRAAEKGWLTSRPTVEAVYDLILDDGKRLYRAQVKYGDGESSHSEGVVVVDLRRRKDGSRYRSKSYDAESVDLVLVHVPKLDKVLRLDPVLFDGHPTACLRISPAKNGQNKGTHDALKLVW
jgi:PD-(D/E)XK endonuclease